MLIDGNYDGNWRGSFEGTSSTGPLDVEVIDNRITHFQFFVTLVSTSPARLCWEYIYLNSGESFPISNSSFRFTINKGGGKLTTDIAGSAASLSKISGTIGELKMNKHSCGGYSWTGTMPATTFTITR